MSYILEALQRADQERKRAQPVEMPLLADGVLESSSLPKRGRWLGGVVAIMLLVSWAWSQLPSDAPTQKVSKHELVKSQVKVEADKTVTTVVSVKVVKPAVKTKVLVPKQATVSTIPPAPVTLAELPLQVRAELPAMQISALIGHQDPARRVAWINDRALHIGQWVTKSVRLVAIGKGDVTLAFQGYQIVITPFDQSSRLWR